MGIKIVIFQIMVQEVCSNIGYYIYSFNVTDSTNITGARRRDNEHAAATTRNGNNGGDGGVVNNNDGGNGGRSEPYYRDRGQGPNDGGSSSGSVNFPRNEAE